MCPRPAYTYNIHTLLPMPDIYSFHSNPTLPLPPPPHTHLTHTLAQA
jgi:hypothetical protein